MAFELAVSTYSLSRWKREHNKSTEQVIDWIAGAGVGGIEFCNFGEIAPDRDGIKRASTLRKRCEKRGLAVASYCVGAELLTGPRGQKKTVEQLKRHVDIAATLGAPSMRHDVTRGPTSQRKKMTLAQVLKKVAPAVRQVAEYGAESGVITSLENHGFYLQTADRVQKLIEAVDHPNYRLTMDLGNFLCLNQDPVAACRQLATYAVMVHAKDFLVRPKRQTPPNAETQNGTIGAGWIVTPTAISIRGTIAGHGQVDLPAQIAALKRAKYRGYLSLEFEGIEPVLPAVELGLAYLRQLVK